MPVRKITDKQTRVRVVNWIRNGAPIKEGVPLYASLPYTPGLLANLKRNPDRYADSLKSEICTLLGITRHKFETIIKQYHGTKYREEKRTESTRAHVEKETAIEIQPDRRRSFRNEFPFLSKPECPPELKALAADKISCWERYTEAHKQLFDCSTLEECQQVAHALVENYKENRLIYEELRHYQETGSILGKHRIWRHYEKYKSLRGKNVIELVKLHEKTLPHRIWRIESEIKKGDKPHLKGERVKRLNEVKAELAEVKRLLGMG